MIPVVPQPEPEEFDKTVRQKGMRWLRKHNIDLTAPLPSKTKLPDYWRDCLDELHTRYGGVCAWLAVFFEPSMGGGAVEHFLPKSLRPDRAYEWSNYRFACSRINSCKGTRTDILDPFEVGEDWFYLTCETGHIYPNPSLDEETRLKIQNTIDRLKLDAYEHKKMRARHFQDFCTGQVTAVYLKRKSPFVWKEAKRQGLL